MELVDGRRLTGRSPFAAGPAAAVMVRPPAPQPEPSSAPAAAPVAAPESGAAGAAAPSVDDALALFGAPAFAAWAATLAGALARRDWPVATFTRSLAGALEVWTASAPIDRMYAVLEMAEAAVKTTSIDAVVDAAQAAADVGGDPALLALQERALALGLPLLWDDDAVSIGLGHASRTFERPALAALGVEGVQALPLQGLARVPTAIVTGTNGKTTTTRMLARIARCAGYRAGATSTDGLAIDGALVEAGDWTGPGGARALLRDARVELAVLEAARGGMLRRGLQLEGCDAAAVTNVSADHLGEWAIDTVEAMAAVKLLVAQALRPGGRLAIFDDGPGAAGGAAGSHGASPLVTAAATVARTRPDIEILRFAARPRDQLSTGPGRSAGWLDGDALVLDDGRGPSQRIPVASIPLSFGGAARHNLDNALCAALLARGLDLPASAVADGLASLRPDTDDSPGRANAFTLRGGTVIVDFGHNPDGLRAMAEMVVALPARRRYCVVGQAGDRSDADIAGLARALWPAGFHGWYLKNMPHYDRGRPPGQVVAILADALGKLGAAPEAIHRCDDEESAAIAALAAVGEGDLLLLLAHEDCAAVVRRCLDAGATPWSVAAATTLAATT